MAGSRPATTLLMNIHDPKVGKPDGAPPARSIHPGSGRRRTRETPKGRQVDPQALEEVRALLGDRPRRADLLIEHLHLLQDHYGCLHARHLVALADEMRLALVEVYEVASFYAHFDIVHGRRAGAAAGHRPGLRQPDLRHDGCRAAARGAEGDRSNRACASFARPAWAAATTRRSPRSAMRCTSMRASRASRRRSRAGETHPHIPAYADFDRYRAEGGYKLLADCLAGRRPVEDIIKTLEDSNLRGLGGAGFPTGRKWRFVRAEPAPRLMAVNADEGEPGTFKDRHYLETDPHRFLEGMLIGAWAVEAAEVYIYLRDEYPQCREILLREIAQLEAAGLSRGTKIHLRRGAGAYICGEESAMLESIEGKRGLPRHKPPFPSQVGLFGRPTLINNVETLFWVRDIVEKGPEWFASQGRNGRKGLRTFSVSGRVKNPGVKLAPAGITVRELIDEYCGGMAEGHTLQGLPAGRRLRRHPAGRDGRHPARLRHARAAWLLHRLGRGRRALGPGRHARGRAQPDAGSSRTRAAASARPAGSAPRRRSS